MTYLIYPTANIAYLSLVRYMVLLSCISIMVLRVTMQQWLLIRDGEIYY